MSTLSGQLGAVLIQTSDAASAFTKEVMTDVGGTHLVYTITAATKRFWDDTTTTLVYVNDVLTSTGFTIDYIGGTVTFAVSQGTNPVTVTGANWTVSEMMGFSNWKLDLSTKILDTTTFNSGLWEEFITDRHNFKITADKYFIIDDVGVTYGEGSDVSARLGTKLVVRLFVDDSASLRRFEGYAMLDGDGINDSPGEVIKESISFTGVGKLYYREG